MGYGKILNCVHSTDFLLLPAHLIGQILQDSASMFSASKTGCLHFLCLNIPPALLSQILTIPISFSSMSFPDIFADHLDKGWFLLLKFPWIDCNTA